MKNSVMLPILFHTEESANLEQLGIFNSDNMEFRDIRFYVINVVAPAIDADYGIQSLVYSGEHSFECALTMKEVEELIEENFR